VEDEEMFEGSRFIRLAQLVPGVLTPGEPLVDLEMGAREELPSAGQVGAWRHGVALVRCKGMACCASGYEERTMKLSRREVYGLVWSAPMTAIGRLLCISSVSLAKTCARRASRHRCAGTGKR